MLLEVLYKLHSPLNTLSRRGWFQVVVDSVASLVGRSLQDEVGEVELEELLGDLLHIEVKDVTINKM